MREPFDTFGRLSPPAYLYPSQSRVLIEILQSCIAARFLSSTSPASISQIHRFLSAAAPTPADSPNPSFTVEDYLVDTCGLTLAQALKASSKLSSVKSPTKPDAVLGLSSADVAAAVAKDPHLLCAKVEGTLSPVVSGLTGLGLSRPDVSRLVLLAPANFRCRSTVSNLSYYMSLFGSYENLLRALRFNSNFLTCEPKRTVKPNVVILRECGLGDCDIAKLGIAVPWLLTADRKHLQAIAARAEGLGVPRGSGMFRHALHAVAFLGEEKIATRVDYLKNNFMWSDAEVAIAVCKLPMILRRSKDDLQRRSEFLISEVGLKPPYIAHRPALLTYSLEGRLRPRYYVVKFLNSNGLLDNDRDYYRTVIYIENVFLEKFVCPHKDTAPRLAEDYEAACRGEVPTRFRFA